MSATKNCDACSDLQENSPEFVLNGVTDNVYNSIINDTGFNPSSGHNDCTDLNNANDCLIGNMEDEVDSYDVCDWKLFMPDFIHNLWTTLKATIASICGLWTKVNRHDCEINAMFNGKEFNVGENTDGVAYAVAGKGVSFILPSAESANTTDLHLDYIAGGLMRGGGSFQFKTENWDEERTVDGRTVKVQVGNFDLDATTAGSTGYHKAYNRYGNSIWANAWTDSTRPVGGELICEFRIKNSAYPYIKRFFPGFGQNSNNGCFMVRALVFNSGGWAYGQHGSCYGSSGSGHAAGEPTHPGYSYGHQVEPGWTYIQLRMSNNFEANNDGKQLSPTYFMGIRMSQDNIEC